MEGFRSGEVSGWVENLKNYWWNWRRSLCFYMFKLVYDIVSRILFILVQFPITASPCLFWKPCFLHIKPCFHHCLFSITFNLVEFSITASLVFFILSSLFIIIISRFLSFYGWLHFLSSFSSLQVCFHYCKSEFYISKPVSITVIRFLLT